MADPASKAKAPSRKRMRQSATEGAAKAVPTSKLDRKLPLPATYTQLVEVYDAVDRVCCFLLKQKLSCKLTSVQSMVAQLCPRLGNGADVLLSLQRVATASPEVVELRSVPQTDDPCSDGSSQSTPLPQAAHSCGEDTWQVHRPANSGELAGAASERTAAATSDTASIAAVGSNIIVAFPLPKAGGSGTGHAKRRSELVRQGLLKQVMRHHTAFLASDAAAAGQPADETLEGEQAQSSSEAAAPSPAALKARGKGKARKKAAVAYPNKGQWHPAFDLEAVPLPEPTTAIRQAAAAPETLSKDAAGAAAEAFNPLDAMARVGKTLTGQALPEPAEKGGEATSGGGQSSGCASPPSEAPFDARAVLEHLQGLPLYKGQIAHVEVLPARPARHAETAAPLPAPISAALQRSKGVTRLFWHQAVAIDAALAGKHVAISTSTSSGKSIAFNVPVAAEALARADPVVYRASAASSSTLGGTEGRPLSWSNASAPANAVVALYIFPTKALAQDQLRSLRELMDADPELARAVRCAAMDGDSSQAERAAAALDANVVLTNPDMLHVSTLPAHKRCKRFFQGLRYVVLDESHVYRGVFGSQVSHVLRRLLRLCALYAPHLPPPQFICCSATMRDPRRHFSALVPLVAAQTASGNGNGGSSGDGSAGGGSGAHEASLPLKDDDLLVVVTDDTAPRGEKLFVLWNPPKVQKLRSFGCTGSLKRSRGQTQVSAADGAREKDGKDGAGLEADIAAALPQTDAPLTSTAAGDDRASADDSVQLATRTQDADAAAAGTEDKGVVNTPPAASSCCASSADRPLNRGAWDRRIRQRAAEAAAAERDSSDTQALDAGDWRELELWAGLPHLNAPAPKSPSHDEDLAAAEGGEAGASDDDLAAAAALAEAQIDGSAGEGASCSQSASGRDGGGEEEEWRRRSSIVETALLFAALVKQRVRTLAFCRTRKLTELVLRYANQDLTVSAPQLLQLVRGYRGGYTKGDRREIERELFADRLLGVTATSALELGVDIGSLDVTLHLGFPGSISSLWQQAGRAGRAGRPSLAIMILFQDPISQWFVRSPSDLLSAPPEEAVLDPLNLNTLRSHIHCAAAELPLALPGVGAPLSANCSGSSGDGGASIAAMAWGGDAGLFGGARSLASAIEFLSRGEAPALVKNPVSRLWVANPASVAVVAAGGGARGPAAAVSLRMIDPVSFQVVDDASNCVLDTIEYHRAFFELFEGAIYLHQARQYQVFEMNLRSFEARVRAVRVSYYTSSHNETTLCVTKVLEACPGALVHTGCCDVVDRMYGWVKVHAGTGSIVERNECNLQPLEYSTRCIWIDLPPDAMAAVAEAGLDLDAGVHAAAHALLGVIPLFLMCDSGDLNVVHVREYRRSPAPKKIIVYDRKPGGVGVAEALFRRRREVLVRALQLVANCDCAAGCLACIHTHSCTGYNSLLDKAAAALLLRGVLRAMQQEMPTAAATAAAAAGSRASAAAASSGHDVFCGEDSGVGGGGWEEEEEGAEQKEKDVTPRKRKREMNLLLAKGMPEARQRDWWVRSPWMQPGKR